jgi:hypothetical protein
MKNKIDELIAEWRDRGPVSWVEGPYGWIGIDGSPAQLTEWQRAALLAWWDHREEITTFAISNIKKTGKTFLNAALLAWRWLALPGLHFAVANDLDQSMGRQFAEIAEMVKRNPFLRDNTKIGKGQLEFIPTGSILMALAGDATGNAGSNHLTASFTEAWGIIYEQGIRNYEELTPPPGRFSGLPALRIIDSYAGFLEESNTWHQIVDRALDGNRLRGSWPIYKDGGLLLFHMEGLEAQRRCFRGSQADAEAYYKDQRASLRENSYKRLHENFRTVNIGNFIDQEVWESLVDPDHRPLPPGSNRPVYIGLDLAVAPGGDNCALIGTYYEQGKVKIAFHKVWKGGIFRIKKLNISETVQPFILAAAKTYNLAGVYFDPWQAVHLAEQLREAGIRCIEVTQSHSNRGPKDTTLYELAASGKLILYDNEDLRNMASGASAKELSNGQIYLAKAGGRSKIDLLVALSNCADECNLEGSGFGQARSIPNIFYDHENKDGLIGNLDDFMYAGNQWLYLPDRKRGRHPPGITWQNCQNRNRGCEACVIELNAAGYFEEQEQLKQQYREQESNKNDPDQQTQMDIFLRQINKPPMEVQDDGYKFKQIFKAAARRRLAKQSGKPEGDAG